MGNKNMRGWGLIEKNPARTLSNLFWGSGVSGVSRVSWDTPRKRNAKVLFVAVYADEYMYMQLCGFILGSCLGSTSTIVKRIQRAPIAQFG